MNDNWPNNDHHYEHPPAYHPPRDTRHNKSVKEHMDAINHHINDIFHNGYHNGHLQHLGGAAAIHDHLRDLHYGHAHAVKKELKRVIDYLYYYCETGHEIYHFLAEDAFWHVQQLRDDISNPEEQAHVNKFLDYVREYMSWLKMNGHHRNDRHDHNQHPVEEDHRNPAAGIRTPSL